MVTDEQAEAAVDWLRDNADTGAKAKAERLYVEHYLKTVKAQESSKSDAKTVAERENEALLSKSYLSILQAYKEAVEADERHRFMREAAMAKVEYWRTASANQRRN
jgi:hypothetical protein